MLLEVILETYDHMQEIKPISQKISKTKWSIARAMLRNVSSKICSFFFYKEVCFLDL